MFVAEKRGWKERVTLPSGGGCGCLERKDLGREALNVENCGNVDWRFEERLAALAVPRWSRSLSLFGVEHANLVATDRHTPTFCFVGSPTATTPRKNVVKNDLLASDGREQ
ncbi:hypothetical protein [Halobacterium sp. KA-6]|uniref:hypothetical protein n=1 Tax=Halobacterium sp. KA-6 TaxID=2896368 RepID=UPI001E5EA690|nr:hypothetical protein [Halobacterium sp. KA-6]MCD2202068.1 hypothetical protein [Halobacterium sp. KA-6]